MPKVRKTFSIGIDVWSWIFDNIPEGERSQFVEEAIRQRIRRESVI